MMEPSNYRANGDSDDNTTTIISDEEHGGTEILTITQRAETETTAASATAVPATIPAAEKPQQQQQQQQQRFSKRCYTIAAIVTLLAIIIVSITAPLLHKSINSRKKPDKKGADETMPPTLTTEDSHSSGSTTDDNDNGNSSDSTTEDTTTASSPPKMMIPFENIQLPYYSSEIIEGYSNQTDFELAMTEAAKFLVNKVVLRQLGSESTIPTVGSGSGGGGGWGANANDWRVADDDSSSSSSEQGFRDVTDYETNTQEKGIDEADLMKADDNYVYAAYSNYVLVWDATNGKQVTQVEISASNGGDETVDSDTRANSGGDIFGGGAILSGGSGSKQQPKIESLLLVDEHLVVIISGSGPPSHNSTSSTSAGERTVLEDHLGTEIQTYKTSSIAINEGLTLLGTKKIHGRFLDARSVGNQVHVTTTSGIDTYTDLMAPFQRFSNFPSDLTDEEYVDRVRFQASDKYIPFFVQKLSSELSYKDPTGQTVLPNLLQVNRWQTDGGENGNDGRAKVDDILFASGVINSVTLVSSFDVTAAPLVAAAQLNHELVTSQSCFLAPSRRVHIYGTETKLVLATLAWNWNAQLQAAEQVTHLVLLGVETSSNDSDFVSTSFRSVGMVRGYLLNPYSLDIVDDKELRVATTVTRRWRLQGGPLSSSSTNQIGNGNSQRVDVSDRSVGQEEEKVVEQSLTENYISVVDLNGNSFEERGVVQLGEQDEVIMAVRFFDKIAYCVTFQQTDPFYVVDLETVSVLGEFKLNGFSNYLHPLNDDKTLLMGIGQNVTDEGVASGFMITVFNATDPTRPKVLVHYTVDDNRPTEEGNTVATTQSVAQWDYKSFRYVDESNKLVVPMNVVTYTTDGSTADAIRHTVLGTFEGFVIFDVNPEDATISEDVRVSHATEGCHYCGSLASRSFVYDGNIMTIEGNIVSSVNLESSKEQWTNQVEVEGEEALCCY